MKRRGRKIINKTNLQSKASKNERGKLILLFIKFSLGSKEKAHMKL